MVVLKAGQSVYVLGHPLEPVDLVGVDTFDQIIIDGRQTDIKALRGAIGQFQQTPAGSLRVLAINWADKLSELMQNTLLKVIEEPPVKGAIILHVASVDSLLPTVRSRLSGESARPSHRLAGKSIDISRVAGLDRLKAAEFLEQSLLEVDLSTAQGVAAHRLLSRAVLRLRQNLNSKLVIDGLLLNWTEEFGKE